MLGGSWYCCLYKAFFLLSSSRDFRSKQRVTSRFRRVYFFVQRATKEPRFLPKTRLQLFWMIFFPCAVYDDVTAQKYSFVYFFRMKARIKVALSLRFFAANSRSRDFRYVHLTSPNFLGKIPFFTKGPRFLRITRI